MKVVMPPEVWCRSYQDAAPDSGVSDMPAQHTKLFRAGTGVDEVLGLVTRERRSDKPLRVISGGSSFGPEVDTILALAHRNLLGPIDITGVDADPDALEAAQLGRYRVGASIAAVIADYRSRGYDFHSTMREHGIGVDVRESALATERLRSSHRVTWRLGDLASGQLSDRPADLILCNNVMYYYRDDSTGADAIASNLADNLAPSGVVSFGANLTHAGMTDWVRNRLTPMFEARGLLPVVSDDPLLHAFQHVPRS